LVNDIKKKYKKTDNESFAAWKKGVKDKIIIDKDIKSTLKKRTNLYKKEREIEYNSIMQSLQEELQRIENILFQLNGNNKDIIKIQE
jgi:hypothetical protein